MKREGGREVTADVVVVGGGPGGAVAAKNCAQRGIRTILLERYKLPRRKVCTGMLHSNMACAIIAREFGTIPDEVWCDPPYTVGMIFHTFSFEEDIPREVSTVMSERVPNLSREAEENSLDYWMVQKAKEAGAEVWEEALVTNVIQGDNGITVKFRRLGEEREIVARFVVGADGAESVTSKSLYPNLTFQLNPIIQEGHAGWLELLDRRYSHRFVTAISVTPKPVRIDWAGLRSKKGYFIVTAHQTIRPLKEALSAFKQILTENWGFDPESKPLWSDGTNTPQLMDDLFTGRFVPAKGNVLLVGEAAGLNTPTARSAGAGLYKALGGEGINLALKSGVLAASAIAKAANTSQEAAAIYLNELQQVISVLIKVEVGIIRLEADSKNFETSVRERNRLLDQLI